MARIERVYWCGDCGHECHCHINQCDEWLGIGMTDKSFQCECEKCNCASTHPEWGVTTVDME